MRQKMLLLGLLVGVYYFAGCSSLQLSSGDVSLSEVKTSQDIISKKISVYEEKIEYLSEDNVTRRFYDAGDKQIVANDSLIAFCQRSIVLLEQESDGQLSRLANRDRIVRFDLNSFDTKQAAELFILSQTMNVTGTKEAKNLKGLLVNFLNSPVIATVVGPGGFKTEVTISKKSDVIIDVPSYGQYNVSFRSTNNQREGHISKMVAPNVNYYSDDGVRYDLVASALRLK